MREPYFIRVARQTPTEFWINNPTRAHADLALGHGATGCTTNPSYTQKMIDDPTEGSYALHVLDETLRETQDDTEAVALFQRKLVGPICDKFLPLYQQTYGRRGHVSMQGDPIHEDDPDTIIEEALENRKVGPNVCCKIPTTLAGIQAMEVLVEADIPLIATEIFGIAQAIALIESYTKITRRTGKHPPLYLAHIAGIYDDYLRSVVEREQIDISSDVLWQGGLAVARRLYQLIKKRDYPGIFLAGGARGTHHFTEMVGGEVCCTINWEGTADTLLAQDPPVVSRLFNPVQRSVLQELMEKLPDFARGYREDGLQPEEFADFGPVRLFRGSFINSWRRVLTLVHARRELVA